ncbi:MAG: hypothetical protein ABR540_05515 [Acidimicrobiales bacterium]
MSVGGVGIPRLQDLSYIEVAIAQVAAGATFEQVRRALVARAAEINRDADVDGSFDEQKWAATRSNSTKHVHNAVDVLKELMRLGWLQRHILPSGPQSAYLHAEETYDLTDAGKAWAALVAEDRVKAYNALVGILIDAHPQFAWFLKVVGARPDSTGTHLTVPLLRWDGTVHADEEAYLEALIDYAAGAGASGSAGWSASRDDIDSALRSYVLRIQARFEARERKQSRKEFVNTCDEAITKLAFTAAGCPLDYVSMELLRRWTRFLGIANFSYYAQEPYALRLWATGTVAGRGERTTITRRVGPEVRQQALEGLWETWQERRGDAAAGMYLPIWDLRAATCWKLRIGDDEFDRAIAEALAGVHPDLPFRIHLDQASARSTPASTRPLILPTASGLRRVFNVISIIPNKPKEQS